MSFSKLQAALVQFSQETTIAKLADFNFDFTLVKLEAPSEFKALGAALSKTRRSNAESGSTHVIARKLGALFQSMLPDTPNLIRAYGQRASDISQSPSVNPKGSKSHGPFQEFVGVDGTTIWAAATSGSSAVAVHLLACILAFVWSPTEATSIWEELVAERKKELEERIDSDEFLAKDFGLAKQVVTKEELQDWDASARAWLRAADGAQITEKQQEKLMRVVKKVHLPIGSRQQVYSGVTEAWKTALETVDKIITGIPYSVVRDGAVLVALSAWHLYPDIVVLGSTNEEVLQNDNLIARGGIVTIGLTGKESELKNGVYWSLSLAHLRFYGPPEVASRSIDSDSGRMTVMELTQTILGATMACWGLERREIDAGMTLIALIEEKLRLREQKEFDNNWISFLAQAVAVYRNSANDERTSCERSVYRGYRHPGFLTKRKCKPLGFDRLNAVSLIRKTGDKVQFLRSKASKISPPLEADSWIIWTEGDRDRVSCQYHFSSAVPIPVRGNSSPQYCHWVSQSQNAPLPEISEAENIEGFNAQNIQKFISGMTFAWKNAPSQLLNRERERPLPSPTIKTRLWSLQKKKREQQEEVLPESKIEFQLVAGDTNSVALFEKVRSSLDLGKIVTHDLFPKLSITEMNDYIKRDMFGSRALRIHLSILGEQDEQKELLQSLRAVASCVKIYENFPGATISPEIIALDKPIGTYKWALATQRAHEAGKASGEDKYDSFLAYNLSRQCAFAVICMLDTGNLDMDPSYLDDVMAISSGDSLYIAAPLLYDPATELQPSDIRRVVGNIGRAGLALLIPPKNPEIRQPDPNMWKVINHNEFKGSLEDCFPNTSLHLSFTGYVLPVVVGDHGSRFVEAFYIETRISVHDSGKWVADIDPLAALLSPKFSAIVQQPHCKSKPVGHRPDFEMTSIENWEELLDLPNNAAVVKVHGNWQARLATTAVSIGLGRHAIIFQGHGCWTCGQKTLQLLQKEQEQCQREALEVDPNDAGIASSADEGFPGQSSEPEMLSSYIFVL